MKYSWTAILNLIPGVIAVYPGEAGKPLWKRDGGCHRLSPSVNKYHHLHTLSPYLNTNSPISAEQFIVSSALWRDVGDLCHSICWSYWWYERSPAQYLRDNASPSNKTFTQLHCKKLRCKVLKSKNLNSSFSSWRGERVETLTISVCALKCGKYDNYDHSRS